MTLSCSLSFRCLLTSTVCPPYTAVVLLLYMFVNLSICGFFRSLLILKTLSKPPTSWRLSRMLWFILSVAFCIFRVYLLWYSFCPSSLLVNVIVFNWLSNYKGSCLLNTDIVLSNSLFSISLSSEIFICTFLGWLIWTAWWFIDNLFYGSTYIVFLPIVACLCLCFSFFLFVLTSNIVTSPSKFYFFILFNFSSISSFTCNLFS